MIVRPCLLPAVRENKQNARPEPITEGQRARPDPVAYSG